MSAKTPSLAGPIITGTLAVVAFVAALIGYSMIPTPITPERVNVPSASSQQDTSPEASATSQPTSPTAKPSATPKPLTIKASDIVRLKIAALKIDVGASGPTMPRKSERCHGGSTCIDPPELKTVAWYGAYARPSLPSTDSVLIFGHSNHYNAEWQTFNNLPAAEKGDKVVVTTKNGIFTYAVKKVALIKYDDVPYSELIFGHEPNRLVLVTCNAAEQAGTVVVADLVSAKRR